MDGIMSFTIYTTMRFANAGNCDSNLIGEAATEAFG